MIWGDTDQWQGCIQDLLPCQRKVDCAANMYTIFTCNVLMMCQWRAKYKCWACYGLQYNYSCLYLELISAWEFYGLQFALKWYVQVEMWLCIVTIKMIKLIYFLSNYNVWFGRPSLWLVFDNCSSVFLVLEKCMWRVKGKNLTHALFICLVCTCSYWFFDKLY